MSNERLGIYEELQARRDRYGDAARLRRQLLMPASNGASAQSVNPFMRHLRTRIQMAGKPNSQPGRGATQHNKRTTWPEARLGVSLVTVIKTVIDDSEATMGEIFSTDRHRRVSRPRQVVFYMIDRYCPDYSLPQIGYIFSLDHTTIMAAIEAVTMRLLDKDQDTVDLVNRAHAHLRALAA